MLTIIIPIYKVEKYIAKCLNSIVFQAQTSNVEIILVDDGSPDKSIKIAKDIVSKYQNVTIIYQENKGLSAARNIGLKSSNTKYVWFIDSDDSIMDNCLPGIIEELNSDIDILLLRHKLVFEDGRDPKYTNYNYFDGIKSGKEVLLMGGIPTPAQFTIYKRDFLIQNNLLFSVGRLHEDIEFKPKVLYLARSVKWHNKLVYNYLQRNSGSIMNSFKLKNGIDILFAINNIISFKKNVSDYDCIKAFNCIIGKYVNSLMQVYWSLPKRDRITLKGLLRDNNHIFDEIINTSKIKYVFEALAFKMNITVASYIVKILIRK